MDELNLIVIWDSARHKGADIVADLAKELEIVADYQLSWPIPAEAAFRKFYGVKLKTAAGKVKECGEGSFRLLVVRDTAPVYEDRNTSRGIERVNARMFDLKMRYRSWTGGGHKIHATNGTVEMRRDILILTGHKLDEWQGTDIPAQTDCHPFPGLNGWNSLPELFTFLNETTPYAVIRNSEMLPGAFDPSLHGDIDFLVEDSPGTAGLLHARKVHDIPTRVHYEITVAGSPVRLDLRYVGDDYYCEEWERHILSNVRDNGRGVKIPSAEDGFYALVYHALYQKYQVAPDYRDKVAALAREAGIGGDTFDDWLPMLEQFLAARGYDVPRPIDRSVRFNRPVVEMRKAKNSILRWAAIDDLRPARLGIARGNRALPTLLFTGVYNGRSCFVKYSLKGESTVRRDWQFSSRMRARLGVRSVNPLCWHLDGHGGAFIVTERVAGRPLSEWLVHPETISPELSGKMTEELLAISDALIAEGVAHRDIRPENLLVADDGTVTLLDYQMSVEYAHPVECNFVANHYFDLLRKLGGKRYRIGYGVWNDRLAMLETVRQLPACAMRKAVEERLSKDSSRYRLTASLPSRMRKIIVRDIVKSALSRLSGNSSWNRGGLRFLVRALATWRFL